GCRWRMWSRGSHAPPAPCAGRDAPVTPTATRSAPSSPSGAGTPEAGDPRAPPATICVPEVRVHPHFRGTEREGSLRDGDLDAVLLPLASRFERSTCLLEQLVGGEGVRRVARDARPHRVGAVAADEVAAHPL